MTSFAAFMCVAVQGLLALLLALEFCQFRALDEFPCLAAAASSSRLELTNVVRAWMANQHARMGTVVD